MRGEGTALSFPFLSHSLPIASVYSEEGLCCVRDLSVACARLFSFPLHCTCAYWEEREGRGGGAGQEEQTPPLHSSSETNQRTHAHESNPLRHGMTAAAGSCGCTAPSVTT